MSQSQPRRAARMAMPALIAALALAGCGGAAPGTAATVGSERLTVAEVQERTAAFLEAYPDMMTSGVTTAQVTAVTVENFIRAAVVEATAASLGADVTAAEIDEFVASNGGFEEVTRLTAGAGVPPDPELVNLEIRTFMLQTAIGETQLGADAPAEELQAATLEALDATSARLDIEVNPRYGTWNGTQVTSSNGSLSLTLAELRASQELPPTERPRPGRRG